MQIVKAEQTLFSSGWWGVSLDKVGLEKERPDVGTYGLYDHSNLPPLSVPLDGSFSWLRDAPKHDFHIGIERRKENERSLSQLVSACRNQNVGLPHSFVEFLSVPELQACVRSCTDCFIDLAVSPVPSPTGKGSLIRFLADSQGCVFWYIFIPSDSNDHAIVSSSNFYDPEDTSEHPGAVNSQEGIVFAEESFEGFICRFWIENELWFSDYDGTPISEICRRYVAAYQTEN